MFFSTLPVMTSKTLPPTIFLPCCCYPHALHLNVDILNLSGRVLFQWHDPTRSCTIRATSEIFTPYSPLHVQRNTNLVTMELNIYAALRNSLSQIRSVSPSCTLRGPSPPNHSIPSRPPPHCDDHLFADIDFYPSLSGTLGLVVPFSLRVSCIVENRCSSSLIHRIIFIHFTGKCKRRFYLAIASTRCYNDFTLLGDLYKKGG